ncbi:MAG TPA: phosphatase PAP2 family protein [Gemmatimonadaceae bacterium]|nr:phosphatase PAP2 family protein [Gemmatimonadaceae bacterium]
MIRMRCLIWPAIAIATSTQQAAAQTPMPGDSVHASRTLFTYRDAALAAGFIGLTLAMFPVDKQVAGNLQNQNTQANKFFKNASTGVTYLADPGAIIIGVTMYGVGKLGHWRNVADLGLHGTEAVAISGGFTQLLKGVAGRARPFVTSDTNAHDFSFGRGFGSGSYSSFPSGHATSAFAVAAVVTSESQRWWPHQTWLVAPAMYGGATLVGLSRMYNNKHWASDVALGAAIGTFTGIKVVRYSHGHPTNRIDHFFLGPALAPATSPAPATGRGITLGYSIQQ